MTTSCLVRFVALPGQDLSCLVKRGVWVPGRHTSANVYFLHGLAMQEDDDAPLAFPQTDYDQQTEGAFMKVCPSLCNRHHPVASFAAFHRPSGM